MQKVDVEVRPVYCRMATRAIATRLETQPAVGHVSGEWIYVTLQAQETGLPPDQQHPVDTAVRSVTRGTAFDFHGGVLEDKRSAFLHMALRAGFPAALAKCGPV